MKTTHSKEDDMVQAHATDQQLYILTGHWISDLRFYQDDLRFLYHLIDKYIIWITKKEHLDKVSKLRAKLYDVKTVSKALLQKVAAHRSLLSQCVENTNDSNAGIYIMEHAQLEDEMAAFVKLFRQNRKEVMDISGFIIDSEELANILEN